MATVARQAVADRESDALGSGVDSAISKAGGAAGSGGLGGATRAGQRPSARSSWSVEPVRLAERHEGRQERCASASLKRAESTTKRTRRSGRT